jgi:hypothetical protein
MLTNGRYGYFRDELYYLAASDHLALGYVDFAPLMAWFTHASRFVFGDSLHAIRLLPAVAFGAEVLLTGFHHAGTRREALGHIARIRLGAARSGHPRQRHASFHESPRAAVLDGLDLFPVPRNPPATAKIAIVVRSAVGLWPREQALTVFFLSALVVRLLATLERRPLTSKWFWIAAAIAFAIAFPNVCLGISASLPYARRPAPCKSDSQERRIATSAIYWPAVPGARSGQRPRLDCWTRLPALPPRWEALSLPGRDISRLPWP